MAGRSLENLRKRYNSSASAPGGMRPGPKGPGPGRGPAMGKPKDAKKTIARVFSYIRQYKLRLGVVLMCMVLNTGATLVGGYMLRPILNHIAEAGIPAAERIRYLLVMLLVLLAA